MKSIWRGLVLILTLDCEGSAWLVSESLDRRLTLAERWAVRLHHLVCRSSRELAKQIRDLHAQAARLSEKGIPVTNTAPSGLSTAARERIAASLKKTRND